MKTCRNMKIIILTAYLCVVSGAQVNPSPRSVNVALETSFLFEPKDVNDNISFIKNIKVFLDKLYKILAPQAQAIQQYRANDKNRTERRSSFSDFIQKLGDSFLNFTGPKVKDTVKVLNIEITKITDNVKSAINDVLPDEDMKQYVKDTVNKWTTETIPALKEKLRVIMKDKNPLLTTFARRLNDYYTEDDIRKLNKLLKKLNRHLDTGLDPKKIVKEAIEFGIIEKFENLNSTSKISLMNDMKLLSDFINESKSKNQGERNPSIMKRNNIDIDFSENDKYDRDDIDVGGLTNDSLEKDEIYNELKKTIGKKLKLASERIKEYDKKKLNANEIVVDNVELYVQSLKQPET